LFNKTAVFCRGLTDPFVVCSENFATQIDGFNQSALTNPGEGENFLPLLQGKGQAELYDARDRQLNDQTDKKAKGDLLG
jgi:hypothetical protein